MKLHESLVLKNLSDFILDRRLPNRGHEGMYMVWKTIEYFDPKSILEIGFFAGQTLGLMIEAASPEAKFTSVDNSYRYRSIFENIFPDNSVQFIEVDSRHLKLNQKFDFIMIDGDHHYDLVVNDLKICLPLLHANSILCMDDYYYFDGVAQAIQEYLLGQHNFVPFFCGLQQMFFHHVTHSAEDFLDNYVMSQSVSDIVEFTNINYHGFTVLKGQIFSRALVEDTDIFRATLKFYDI